METESTRVSPFRPSLTGIWNLPPLILHPFGERNGTGRLLDASRASLMLQGLLPSDVEEDELQRRVLLGRHGEVRMLFFVGKDIFRWIEQCQEVAERNEELRSQNIGPQSFAALLVDSPPKCVSEKLERWGVSDQRTIFSRAIGLRSAFEEPPPLELLSTAFLTNYYRYSDKLYACYQQLVPSAAITSENFQFELYGSEEYSQKLEAEFEQEDQD